MVSPDFLVRPYTPGDEEEIVPLLELVFNGWPHFDLKCNPLDHWNWRYRDNPAKTSLVVVGLSDGRIIGCHHRIPTKVKIGDKILPCTFGGDVTVHPDQRRKGVRNSMLDLINDLSIKSGFKFSYFLSDNPIITKEFSNQPRFPHRLINLVRIVDIDKQMKAMPLSNTWLKKIGFRSLKLTHDLKRVFVGSSYQKDDELKILRINRFNKDMDFFLNKINGYYGFIVERTSDYLNWKYCDPRSGDFVIKLAEEEGKVLGYSVLRINKFLPYHVGYIVELQTIPDRLDFAEILEDDAINYFDKNDVNIINYQVVKNHPYEKTMKNKGFLDSHVNIPIFIRTLTPTNELTSIKSIPPNRVFLCWGDYDVLPVRVPSAR